MVRSAIDFESFDDAARNDAAILAAAENVEVIGDPELDRQSRFESFTGCVVEIETTRGERLVARRDAPRGSPGDPLPDKEIEAKFRSNAARVIPGTAIERLVRMVEDFEPLADIAALAGALAPAATK